MREVKTELEIAAPPEAVWKALLDKSSWSRFSDFYDKDPNAPIADGQTFTFGLRLLGMPPVPIKVRVDRLQPEQELRWVGKIPGFRGEHYFLLEPIGEGNTHLVHGELFSGPLGVAYDRMFHQVTHSTYAAFNVGLALHVEREQT